MKIEVFKRFSKGITYLLAFSLILVFSLTLSGCQPGPSSTPPTVKYVKINIEKIERPPQVEEIKRMLKTPPKVAFNKVIRDPFVPPRALKYKGLRRIEVEEKPTIEEKPEVEKETPKKKPAEKMSAEEEQKAEYISQAISEGILNITGIAGNPQEGYMAILRLPSGKTFIIRSGDRVGKYKIVKVLPSQVVLVDVISNQTITLKLERR